MQHYPQISFSITTLKKCPLFNKALVAIYQNSEIRLCRLRFPGEKTEFSGT